MTFNDLRLNPSLLKALSEEGYTSPTPIQQKAIPLVLERKDVLGCAQTGTGKTAAFALPILQILDETRDQAKSKKRIRSLILTPTRELAIQIDDNFKAYGRHTDVHHTVIFGGVKQQKQTNKLGRGTDVLIATPGRLLDLIQQGFIHLNEIEIFVLDEADRMLDMGFINDVRKIVRMLPKQRQTLFFSATMPEEILSLANSILNNAVRVNVSRPSSSAPMISQSVCYVEKQDKNSFLITMLKTQDIKSTLIFTRTKHGADKLAKMLVRNGVFAEAIHGNKSQNARQQVLANFKSGKSAVLVATDIAARGIDVDGLSQVINVDIPNISETYIHRIGRTGRAGAEGKALSLCSSEEYKDWVNIEKLVGTPIAVETADTNEWVPLVREATAEKKPFHPRNGKRAFGRRKFGSGKKKTSVTS
ncbi:MAG: DEAD/DEAH box helicase [Saprospiraceae bacterium]|nr:DEAD/DEAH box helicase [Saprospiraceae bacterium]